MNALDDLSEKELDDDEPIPGTVFNRRQARILKNVVIIMGVMLILGTVLLIVLMARKGYQAASQPQQTAAPAAVSVPLAETTDPASASITTRIPASGAPKQLEAFIPKGAHFVSGNLDGHTYIMTLETVKKDLLILFFDLRTWRLVARADLKQAE